MSKNKETEPSQEIKFKAGDRVKVWFLDKWWPGAVVQIGSCPVKTSRFLFDFIWRRDGEEPGVEIAYEDEESVIYLWPDRPWMYIKTDEKVDDRANALICNI